LRDIPVLASAADLPLVAWSQRPDTLPTQISPNVGYLRRLLVQEILARVGDLGMDRGNAVGLVCALRRGKFGLRLGEHPEVDDGAAHAHRLILEWHPAAGALAAPT
jgi:hypothetical protein